MYVLFAFKWIWNWEYFLITSDFYWSSLSEYLNRNLITNFFLGPSIHFVKR